jgi:hypothetical protein
MSVTLFLGSALSAQAVYLPDFEKPISEAQMMRLDHSDTSAPKTPVTLTLTQKDGADRPSGFLFKEKDREIFLYVIDHTVDSCGVITYQALNAGMRASLTLRDRAPTRCENPESKDYTWHATIETLSTENQKSERSEFVGNPKAIFNITADFE